ncbi:SidA/IucD/PvdA family monooxygenase [Micromonospora sp. NPDC023956]|uniref:SidA/IucD/PvdA family monooxygenase n=1 Tax=Micromonospora sp. NPDC023956 TaxID=3155722 RepID=UPI0034050BB4
MRNDETAVNGIPVEREESVVDVLGVGFGPSNLGLAVCAREQFPGLTCHFLERHSTVRWHPGMMLDGARMQISFLKDLVSLRDPASRYTFLQYTRARGRLEHFVNLNEFRPTRLEYDDYLKWVAEDFTDQVSYGVAVTRVTPVAPTGTGRMSLLRVTGEDLATGRRTSLLARNVVYAPGGLPRLPTGSLAAGPRVVHSSAFLDRFPALFPDRDRPHEFLVAGAGQSAGEIAEYLLTRYPAARVHMAIPGYALRPTDNSPFGNEQFSRAEMDRFHRLGAPHRELLVRERRDANYGVVREDLIDRLYGLAYLDAVRGRQRLVMHRFARLAAVRPDGDDTASPLVATLTDRLGGPDGTVRCDGVVLATGYERSLDPDIFADLLPHLVRDDAGAPVVTREHRVRTGPEVTGGLYVQGVAESAFGLGDTLLSYIPFRAGEILDDVRARVPRTAYPPGHYLEHDREKLFALIERFRFAALVSVLPDGEPVVTQVPLILDRTRGAHGVLFGHLDRANPHADLIDGRRMLALFQGPNSYISPKLFPNDPLPTWNSMSVQVRGAVRPVRDRTTLVRGLCDIADRSEPESLLAPGDPRIDRLVRHIIGFEIEIDELVGRFKLSQDRAEPDRLRAARELARRTEAGERGFIQYVVGLDLTRDDGSWPLAAEPVRPLAPRS